MTLRMFPSMIVAACIAAITSSGGSAWASPPGAESNRKLKKQIEVMERILDEVLVDSKNLLVASHHVTRGIYLQEFGVLFALEATLLSNHHGEWNFDWRKFRIDTENGKTRISFDDDDEDTTKDDKNDKSDKKKEKTQAEKEQSAEERYREGKAEIVDALLDYGETLSTLRDEQWVGVALFLDDNEFFGDRDLSTLLLKAKVGDLRGHAAGKLSKKEMETRIVEEEY